MLCADDSLLAPAAMASAVVVGLPAISAHHHHVVDCATVTPPLPSAAASTPPRSEAPSSPAVHTGAPSSPATVWSDGDRERPPTHGLVEGAVLAIAAVLFVDPRRPIKSNGEHAVRQTLAEVSESGLVSAHVLVCAVSLVIRASEANPRTVSALTIRRIIVAAAMLANKAETDEVFAFAHYVAATGLSADLLKGTEAQLFERLSFDVSTTASQFHRTLAAIVMYLPDADAVDVL
jgi:hypothetical protein